MMASSAEVRSLALGISFGFLLTIVLRHLTGATSSHQALVNDPHGGGRVHGKGSAARRGVPGQKRLYVGVLSAAHFLNTRANALHNAWGKTFGTNIQYYVGHPPGTLPRDIQQLEEMYRNELGIDVVHLKGASDHEYPPQQKMFLMMQSMCDNHLGGYQWYMRADDDVYVRRHELLQWLQRLDPEEMHYIGAFGFGRQDVADRLGLKKGFCMGGPGVLMSHGLMTKLCPHIRSCMRDVVTGEEDTELGRCIYERVGVPCSTAYEYLRLFQHAYPSQYQGFPQPYMGDLLFLVKHESPLTVHHLKESYLMYRMAAFFEDRAHTDLSARVRILEGSPNNTSPSDEIVRNAMARVSLAPPHGQVRGRHAGSHRLRDVRDVSSTDNSSSPRTGSNSTQMR